MFRYVDCRDQYATAAVILGKLLNDAAPHIRIRFGRLPGVKATGDVPFTIPMCSRGRRAEGLRCCIITAESLALEVMRQFSSLMRLRRHVVHIIDEAQMFGRVAEAVAMHNSDINP